MKSKLFFNKSSFPSQTKKKWSENFGNKQQNTYEGVKYDPIYFKEEINNTTTFNKGGDWDINVEIKIKTEKEANQEALNLLKFGVNSICFLNFKNHDLDKILKDIQIEILHISFKDFHNQEVIIKQLTSIAKKRSISTKKLQGSFYNNSIVEKDYKKYIKSFPNYHFIEVKLKSFEDVHKIEKNIHIKHILFTYEPTNLIFWEINKLRSLRIILEKKFQHRPYIECFIKIIEKKTHPLIESCVRSISSILGGCDRITIKSELRNEITIQQQQILKHEAFLDKVSDSLHGSYYIEKLSENHTQESEESLMSIKKTNDYWESIEGIPLQKKYYKKDLANIKHLKYGLGEPPFLRGPYGTMYRGKKWTIRQYAGFSTAEESNKFFKQNLRSGQNGLSVAFDLPTHRGYDSDHERVIGDVGKAGVAIDSIEDMEILFKDIDLEKTSVSMTMNGAIIPIMAFFIAMIQQKNIPLNKISGTIQNDILKEFMVRNTYIYPPKPSMRIVSDIFKYVSKNMPKFNSISVSGYHMLEAGASADIELAYTLSDGLEYVRTGLKAGLKIDDFAPRLSFFWGIGMNFFTEIAKMRAARVLWAEMIQSFNPKNPKSMMLRSHCQTSGWSLTAQEPENNITRTTVEAVAAVMGGTQSLHTNALDEALGLPTNFSAKIARDTQLFLQKETDLCHIIDPVGGSYYIEKLTHDIKEKAKKHIKEIENVGGMLKAIELGIPKLKIEAAAIKRQTSIDNANNLIIGLNCFNFKNKTKLETLEINNQKVRKEQLKKLKKLKKYRNEKRVKKCLDLLSKGCTSKNENLLALAIDAAKEKATLGEISMACEKIFGRYQATTMINSGVYAMEQKQNTDFLLIQQLTNDFEKRNGRRPRILTAKIGQDGHDRGIKIISTSFSDMGFDVDIAPLFQTPKEIAKQSVENDVHIVGVSSLAGGHKTLINELINELKKLQAEEIIIIVGGIIPEKDYTYLTKIGVKKIFGPGTIITEAAIDILKELS